MKQYRPEHTATAARHPARPTRRPPATMPAWRRWHHTHPRAGSGLPVLIALFFITPAAAQPASVSYGAISTHFATSQGTLQGIALHNDEVLTQATTRIAAYQGGILERVRDTTQDGSYGAHNGDGAVLNGVLYISTSNYPTPLHERHAAIARYDAATFTFIEEWTPQGTLTGAGGGVGTRGNELWWPFAHRACQNCPIQQSIHHITETGQIRATYPLQNPINQFGYQTCDWLPHDLLLCPMHGGRGTDYSDLYHFTGQDFQHQAQVPHVFWSSTNSSKGTEYGSQGFALETDAQGNAWTWWAGRDQNGNGGGTGDVARIHTTITPPSQPPDEEQDEDDEDPDVPGAGSISQSTNLPWSLVAAVATGVLVLAATPRARLVSNASLGVALAAMILAYSTTQLAFSYT